MTTVQPDTGAIFKSCAIICFVYYFTTAGQNARFTQYWAQIVDGHIRSEHSKKALYLVQNAASCQNVITFMGGILMREGCQLSTSSDL